MAKCQYKDISGNNVTSVISCCAKMSWLLWQMLQLDYVFASICVHVFSSQLCEQYM